MSDALLGEGAALQRMYQVMINREEGHPICVLCISPLEANWTVDVRPLASAKRALPS